MRLARGGFVVGLAFSLGSPAWALCGPEAELSAESPDVVLSEEIREQAASLGFDPVRIYEFVRNDFEYQPYYGLLRGPEETLRAKRGNEYDLSALLVSLLRVSEDADGNCVLSASEDRDAGGVLDGGTRARFARGRIRITHAVATDWTRTGSGSAAAEFLRATEPAGWQAVSTLRVSADATHLERLHVWVEAEVPLARYRGSGLGGSGMAWISLDPSFKRKDLRDGVALPIGTSALEFDIDAYLTEVRQDTPLEVFEGQLSEYLAQHFPGQSLEDVPIDGPIWREAPGVLPTALPYAVSGALPVQRNPSLVPLHTAGAGGQSPHSVAGAEGANDYRWLFELGLCSGATFDGYTGIIPPACAAEPTSTWPTWSIAIPEVRGRRVLLHFPPAVPTSVGSNGICSLSYSKVAQPTVTVGDSAAVALGPADSHYCFPAETSLRVRAPLPLPGWVDPLEASYPVTVGGLYVVALDHGSWNAEGVREIADALVAAREQHPLVLDSLGNAYVETNGQAGRQTSELFYVGDLEAQKALTGGLLHLAASHYMTHMRKAMQRSAALHHQLPQHMPWVGLVEAAPQVGVLLDIPFLIRPQKLLLDMRGLFMGFYDQASGVLAEGFPHVTTLTALEVSAREHVTWEELTDFEAISTVKGLQVRREQANDAQNPDPGGELLVVTPANADAIADQECNELQFVQKPVCGNPSDVRLVPGNLTRNDVFSNPQNANLTAMVCTGLDVDTYCRIKNDVVLGNEYLYRGSSSLKASFEMCTSFGAGGCCQSPVDQGFGRYIWRALYWDMQTIGCGDFTTDPANAAVELRVAKDGVFQYQSWNGAVAFGYGTVTDPTGTPRGLYLSAWIESAGSGGAGGSLPLWVWDPNAFLFTDYLGATYPHTDSYTLNDYSLFDLFPEGTSNSSLFVDSPTSVFAGDPVSVFTGNYHQSEVDIAIPGRGGHALQLVRSYNSRLAYDGPLGYGWIHTFDQHLRFEANGAGSSDDKIVWVTESGGETAFKKLSSTSFEAPAWSHDSLTTTSAGGPYELVTKAGMKYRFHPLDAQNRARLDRVIDRNGNAIVCEYADVQNPTRLTAVLDTAGRRLAFGYVGGRLRSITDWTLPLRRWEYIVDPAGNLREFRNPVQFAQNEPGVKFEYYGGLPTAHLNHNLRQIIRPEDRDGVAGGDVTMEFFYYANDAVQSHVNALGETTSFFYDFFRRRTTVTNPDGTEDAYIFDGQGNVIRHESARGVVREYEFQSDSHNRLAETDGLGFRTTATYDGLGNILTRTDRLAQTEGWTYNGFSQPLSHEDRRGNRREWGYDPLGNLVEERAFVNGAMRVLRRHEYDGLGNRMRTTVFPEEDGSRPRVTRFFYALNGVDLIRSVDANVHEVRLKPDLLSRVELIETTRSLPGTNAKEALVVETAYDALSRPETTTDPAGTIRGTIFDANGNVEAALTFVPDPAASGTLVPATVAACEALPSCRVDVRNVFDAADQLVATTNALGETTTTEYDVRGRPVRLTSPLRHETRFEYDADGNLIRTVDPTGAETIFVYDAENRVIEARDALGLITTTTYDREGRVVEVLGPGNITHAEVLEYDAEGNPLRAKNANGVESQAEFDELGRRFLLRQAVGEVDAQGASVEAETRFVYDLEGKLVEKIDALGRSTRLHYDVLGRLTEVTSPLGRRTAFAYDEVGNRTLVESPTGEKVRLEYESRGLVTRRFSEGSATGLDVDDHYGYDGLARMNVARSTNGPVRFFEYDALDRAVTLRDPAIGTVRQVFDADGRVVQIGYPGGESVHYGYSARGEVTSVRDPAIAAIAATTGDWQLAYDALGRPVRERDPFGVERRTSYTEAGFVASVSLRQGASLIETFSYLSYDNLGNPGVMTSGEGWAQVQYDPRSRVEKVAYANATFSPCAVGCERFEYDKVGNRTQHVKDGVAETYVVDDDDRLVAIEDAFGQEIASFMHDAAGRRTGRTDASTTTSYAYDPLGRLRTYQVNAFPGSLEYTATDERTTRTDYAGTFRYLGEWYETAPGGQRRLVHGPGIDNVLGQVTTGTSQVRTLLRDGTANVVRTALDGAVGATARRYEAFGAVRSTGGWPIERGFAGRPTEGLSGLINVRARHYDPATGRFLQPDPLGVSADQLYAYAANDPYRFRDPTGAQPWSLSGGQGGPVQTGLGRLAGAGVGLTAGALLAPFLATPVGAGAALAVGGVALYEDYQQGFAGLRSYWDQLGRTDLTFGESFSGALGIGELVGGFGGLASTMGRAGLEVSLPSAPLTRGIMSLDDGTQLPLASGWSGPAAGMPKGSPGFDIVTRTHVEGHAAAIMRQEGLSSATVHINNPQICVSCTRLLPDMLPPNSALTVVLPDGTRVPFFGNAR